MLIIKLLLICLEAMQSYYQKATARKGVYKTKVEKVGLSAIDFVKAVVKGYNQIREGSGDSILLVIFNGDLNHTAGIDLCLSGDYWEVKTAEPRKTEDIVKRKLLWEK